MNIKEVSFATGLSKDMIRFYEKEGLIEPSRNEDNNYRDYSENDCYLLVMIKLYSSLGISLKDIKQFLEQQDMDLAHHMITDCIDHLEKEKMILTEKIKNAKNIQSLLLSRDEYKIVEEEEMYFYPLTSDTENRFPNLFDKYGAGIPVCRIDIGNTEYQYEQGFLFYKRLNNKMKYKVVEKGIYCKFQCKVRHGELIPKELLQPKLDAIMEDGYTLSKEVYTYLIMGSTSVKDETIFIVTQVK